MLVSRLKTFTQSSPAARAPASQQPRGRAAQTTEAISGAAFARSAALNRFARRWLEYAVDPERRWIEPPPAFEGGLNDAVQAFAGSGHQLRQLVRAIATSEVFAAP